HNTFKLATYSAINADSIGQALGLLTEFGNIFDNGLSFSLRQHEDQTIYQLTRRPGSGIKNNYAIEHHLITIHRTLCWMANMRIPLPWVDLDYPAPHYQSEYRYLFYGSPVRFGQPNSALYFDQQIMNLPNVRSFEQLKTFLSKSPLTLLSQTTAPRELSTQVRIWLQRQLQKHHIVPDIDSAASHFDLHPQSMRRMLKKEETSYQDIKMETRRDLAIYLINMRNLRVETIAYQLDFSEPSAFIRAFKGWTGLTPLAYRKLSV
ncbi:MAG: AraC family transcriptional regulator ligand-binding domain-containing protein, partial [Pseudomonadales bacterium]